MPIRAKFFSPFMATESSNGKGSSGRRRRLVKGLLLGSATVGLPALANALIARRREKLGYPAWGRQARFAWPHIRSGYLNHSIEEAVSRLKAPLWLAWGRHVKNPSVESADLWLHHAPSAELDVFEDCGNHPHLEGGTRFSHRFESFLAPFSD